MFGEVLCLPLAEGARDHEVVVLAEQLHGSHVAELRIGFINHDDGFFLNRC